MEKSRKWGLILMVAALSGIGYGVIHLYVDEPPYGIRLNTSDSLPFSVFWSSKTDVSKLNRGIYVTVMHPKAPLPLAKQIVGLPGDLISIYEGCVWVNGINYGKVQETTRSGRPIAPIHEKQIPNGYVFLYGCHPYSYDSRYEEFGLIAVTQVQEILWPLF